MNVPLDETLIKVMIIHDIFILSNLNVFCSVLQGSASSGLYSMMIDRINNTFKMWKNYKRTVFLCSRLQTPKSS